MRDSFFTTFKDSRDFFKKMFLTLFFSGISKVAPGTVGTLVALPFGWAIAHYIAPNTLFLSSLLVSVIAIKVINAYEKEGLAHDRSEIVIDELAGVWMSISMIGHGMLELILAFVLFRLFDIWKPSVIGKIDREIQGGLGVMGDDLLAGFFAGLLGLILVGLLEQLESLALLSP